MLTLLLNADMTPVRVLPWSRAVELLMDDKVYTLEALPGQFVRSQRLAIPWPAVVVLRRYTPARPRVRFSARTVILRDGGACSYCGIRPRRPDGRIDMQALTLDHVIPRAHARGGKVFLPWAKKWVNVTCWENSTCACQRCNSRKGARTPAEAGMVLRALPRVATPADVIRISLGKLRKIPPEWTPYLPETPTVDEPGVLAESVA